MSEKQNNSNKNQQDLSECKSEKNAYRLIIPTSSKLVTSIDMSNQDTYISEEYSQIYMFLKSKNKAFDFSPIFGTVNNIKILEASPTKEEKLNFEEGNNYVRYKYPLNSEDHQYLSVMFLSVSNRKGSLLINDGTDFYYDEDLLSSGFRSNIDD